MTIPLWKKYVSYFFEFHIESVPSEINPHLYVSLNRGRFQLSTANAIYSFADLYDNFALSFRQLAMPADGKEVLILGFGLGSIPYMLEKKFNKKYNYTAVEIDENVLYLANKYVLPELNSPITTIPADAFAYVHYCHDRYDLICMDVFLDDVVPDNFERTHFLQQLAALLNPNGILLFNKLAATKKDKQQVAEFYQRFKQVFPNGTYLDVNGNWMLVNEERFVR
ncbi:MAG: methyltransferase domain-containing protein [Bacteroidota bacterium]